MVGNDFRVDIELECEPSVDEAAAADSLDGTVNYAEVIAAVRREMATPSALLENVAWRISRAIGSEFPLVRGGSVEVTKLMPPCGVATEGVSATISWSR